MAPRDASRSIGGRGDRALNVGTIVLSDKSQSLNLRYVELQFSACVIPRSRHNLATRYLVERFVVEENAGSVHDEQTGTMVLHRCEDVVGLRSSSKITS